MLKFQHPVFFKADVLRDKGGHGATALRGFRKPATLEFDNSRLSISRDVAFLLKQLNTPKHKVSEKKSTFARNRLGLRAKFQIIAKKLDTNKLKQ